MAWPSLVSGDVVSGKGAKTVGQSLYTRAREAISGGTTVYFAEVSETGSSYADKFTFTARVPECVRSGDSVQLTVVAYYDGAGTGDYRARETGGPTNGSAQSLTASYTEETSEITVPDNSWAGAVKTFAVQLQTSGTGTSYAECENIMANLRFKTA